MLPPSSGWRLEIPSIVNSRDSSVSLVNGLRAGWNGVRVLAGAPHPDRFWGPPSLLPIQRVRGGGSFSAGKAAGAWRWALTSSSSEDKNAWSYTSTRPYVFMAWYLVMHRDNFTFSPLVYEGVSKRFRTGRLERELQMIQLSATRCSFIAILWVSLVSFSAITLCFASQRVFIAIYFVIDSVRKLLDKPS
jgi:hypothetical protein